MMTAQVLTDLQNRHVSSCQQRRRITLSSPLEPFALNIHINYEYVTAFPIYSPPFIGCHNSQRKGDT